MTRRGTPIWMAASPMPGASYMVSSMSSISAPQFGVDRLYRLGFQPQPGVGKDEDVALGHNVDLRSGGGAVNGTRKRPLLAEKAPLRQKRYRPTVRRSFAPDPESR